jgi:hypothetical protein
MIMCLLFELDDSLVELVAASPFFFRQRTCASIRTCSFFFFFCDIIILTAGGTEDETFFDCRLGRFLLFLLTCYAHRFTLVCQEKKKKRHWQQPHFRLGATSFFAQITCRWVVDKRLPNLYMCVFEPFKL